MPSIEISEARGVRYLHFGSHWIQGAMRIARPWALELDYTQDMMLALLLRYGHAWPRSALQVGLGAGSITKFLHRHRRGARLKVVEISPDVVTAAWQYFKLPDASPRLDVEVADGHEFMARTTRRFDLIVIDGYDAKARPGMLDSVPFYVNCRARLNEGGVLAANLLTRRRDASAALARMRRAFDDRVLALPPCEGGNTVAFAAARAPVVIGHDELRANALKLKADTGLNLLPTVARLVEARGGSQLTL
jgi:spermidine synthase